MEGGEQRSLQMSFAITLQYILFSTLQLFFDQQSPGLQFQFHTSDIYVFRYKTWSCT